MIHAQYLNLRQRIERSPLAMRLASGAIWLTLGSMLARGLALVATLFVVRMLGRENYGQFAIIQSSIVMAGVFAGMGLGATVIRHIAQLKERDRQHLGRLLSLTDRVAIIGSLLMAALLALGADFIATRVLNTPEISGLLALAALSMSFNVLFGYYNSSLLGFEAVRQSAISQVVAIVFSMPILLGLTYYYGLTGAVWGLIIQSASLFGISLYYYKKQCRHWQITASSNYGPAEWKIMRDFAFPAFLTGIIVMPAHWICHAMLMNTPGGKVEMATIGIVMQWFQMLLFLPAVASRIIMPVLSNLHADNDTKQTGKVLKFSFLANSVTIVPLALLLAAASPWVMAAYGAEYKAEWLVLATAVAAAALSALVSPAGQLIVASGRMWLTSAMNFVWAAVYIGLGWLWIGKGAIGVSMAMFVAYLVLSTWTTLFAFRYQSRKRAQ